MYTICHKPQIFTLTACGGKTKTLQEIVHEKAGDIISVDIVSGNTGAIKTYAEEAQIAKIKEYLGEVSCTKSSPVAATGWSYRFEITGMNGTVVRATFAGANSDIDYEKYLFAHPDMGQFIKELDNTADAYRLFFDEVGLSCQAWFSSGTNNGRHIVNEL